MLSVYNTLSRKKELFLKPGSHVRMFVCGPTVYDYIHLGNARTYVFFDVVARYLRDQGYELTYLQNITDIEDKIFVRSRELGMTWDELASKYTKTFMNDIKNLKITSVTDYPKATDHIPQIITQVQTLLDKGNAYVIEGDSPHSEAGGIYFDLTTFPDYGKLSGRTVAMAEDGVSRIDDSEKKRNKGDFCLWKFSKPGEPVWDSPFGRGRPGWHIEDTAMTEKHFGPQYEVHGGGTDLMFPHHEAELAQQESASGKQPFVQYWMHVGYLSMRGDKMSKSKGNFLTAYEALEQYSPEALRFFLLSAHYRSPLEYNIDSLKAAQAATTRISEFKSKIEHLGDAASSSSDAAAMKHFKTTEMLIVDAMNDDLNVPKAIGRLFELIKKINALLDERKIDADSANHALRLIELIEIIFGIVPTQDISLPPEVQKLIDERENLRKNRRFTEADTLRDDIVSKGFSIDDTPYGPLTRPSK